MIKDNIENKTLSIRISTDGFCFCSYTPSIPGSLKYFLYKPEKNLTLTTNLQKGIELCPFVSDTEKYDVKVIIETNEFTTIPVDYDDKQCYKTFYRHCFPKNDTRIEIVANRLILTKNSNQGYFRMGHRWKCSLQHGLGSKLQKKLRKT